MNKHRNSQKRIYLSETTYFITTVTENRYPWFENEILCNLFVDQLLLCRNFKGFDLFGFAVMWDHVHLMIRPAMGEYNYSEIMKSLKKQFTHNVNRVMGFNDLNNQNKTSYKNGISQHQFEIWDEKMNLYRQQFITQYGFDQNIPKFKWQKSFHDHYIRDERDFWAHVNYIKYQWSKHDGDERWCVVFV